jgi:hypothetical protein
MTYYYTTFTKPGTRQGAIPLVFGFLIFMVCLLDTVDASGSLPLREVRTIEVVSDLVVF